MAEENDSHRNPLEVKSRERVTVAENGHGNHEELIHTRDRITPLHLQERRERNEGYLKWLTALTMVLVIAFLGATITWGDPDLRDWSTNLFSLMIGWAAASIWKKAE